MDMGDTPERELKESWNYWLLSISLTNTVLWIDPKCLGLQASNISLSGNVTVFQIKDACVLWQYN